MFPCTPSFQLVRVQSASKDLRNASYRGHRGGVKGSLVSAVAVVLSLPVLGYGFLNLVAPDVTMRWQTTATSRRAADDPRRAIGRGMQRFVAGSRARVRFIGAIEVAVDCPRIGLRCHSLARRISA